MIPFRLRADLARIATCGAIAALLVPALAGAHDYVVGALKISPAWSRPTFPGAPTAAGYLSITNAGAAPDRLLGGSTPEAAGLEVHSMSVSGGIMRMRPMPDGLMLPAGQTVEAQPNSGVHLMFIRPKHPFRVGDRIPATLRFARAGEVRVEFCVQDAPPSTGAHDHMDHH